MRKFSGLSVCSRVLRIQLESRIQHIGIFRGEALKNYYKNSLKININSIHDDKIL